MKSIVIVGAGGFGREVYQWAAASFPDGEYALKGFVSQNEKDLDGFDLKAKVIGSPEDYRIEDGDRFLIAIGNIGPKKRVVEDMKGRGARFLTLVHSTAVVADNAKMGEGVIVCPFATVSDSVTLGDFVMLNYYASCGHDTKVGPYSILSPYATTNGFAVLEDEVFMGTHSTVAAYKKVGAGSKIHANSVAMRDVPPKTLVHGVPGKNSTIFG